MVVPKSWEAFVKKHYVIAEDVYMFGEQASMKEFEGTYRELLLDRLGYEGEKERDWDEDGWTVNGRVVHRVKDMTDEELLKWFNDANGDGQPYVQVWCVEDRKQVLG